MSCNGFCPEGLRPYELILQRVSEKADRQKSVPSLVPYFLQGVPGPNFFQDLYKGMKPSHKEILKKWGDVPKPAKETLWIGCIGRNFAHDLENSRVLAELPKFSPSHLCCGELHYRSGQWDAFMANTERLVSALNLLKTDRLVCYCGSCTAYLSKFIPKVAGKELPFEVVSIYQWLLEKFEAGELDVKNPMRFTAAIQESCYVTELGESFMDTLRKIYKAAGGDFVELAHNRQCALSCGAASIVRDFKVGGVIRQQADKFNEIKAAGVSETALNCPGCYLTMAPHSWIRGIKLRYMPEELLKAFGDEITTPISGMMPSVIKSFAKRLPLVIKKTDVQSLKNAL
jgi:Fe-S oxidoreductase